MPKTGTLADVGRDLRRAAPELHKELQVGLKAAAATVVTEARLISGFYSSRIPDSIRAGSRGLDTLVVAGGARAPHAVYYEGPKPFRHPVFGNRNVWVKQTARPFLLPAVVKEAPAFDRAAVAAIDATFLKAGFV